MIDEVPDNLKEELLEMIKNYNTAAMREDVDYFFLDEVLDMGYSYRVGKDNDGWFYEEIE